MRPRKFHAKLGSLFTPNIFYTCEFISQCRQKKTRVSIEVSSLKGLLHDWLS